jgi:hypothetical protein
MPLQKEVRIVKIPLSDKERSPDYPIKFPRMSRLYLELLENKAKIRQDLINVEYDSTKHIAVPDHISPSKKSKEKKIKVKIEKDDTPPTPDEPRTEAVKNEGEKARNGTEKTLREGGEIKEAVTPSSHSEGNDHEIIERVSSTSTVSKDALSDRLKELLGDDGDSVKPTKDNGSSSEEFTPYEKYKNNVRGASMTVENAVSPPTLAELAKKGKYHHKAEMRNLDNMNKGDIAEEDEKRHILFKFELLKKSYPDQMASIPEYTIHSELYEMKKSYERTVQMLSINSTVDQYKMYLLTGFGAVEYLFGGVLGFDMVGYTTQQVTQMQSYERLLIELGEQSYMPDGSQWPVEIRLLFVVLMNTAIFILFKMIVKKTGANLLGTLNSLNAAKNQVKNVRNNRKMKGPNIDLDDIPDAPQSNGQSAAHST